MVKAVQIKGVMLDMARVTERHDYYRALPERLARWGCNTVFAHFTDDEGCAMEFARRPELATPHAFSQDQMRRWVGRCQAVGLTVVPEIESFGHTGYIHGRRKYRHLREPTVGHFNALNPLHRESRVILADLVEETAAVFPGPFIHAGLDEVNFGASRQVRRALRHRQAWEIFADHIEFMHHLVRRAGKRMMMWGDHLLHEPAIADRISRDIIICDWHYQADVSPATVEFFTKRGFEVVCCPASNRSGDMVMPNAVTQVNLQRFARIAHEGGRRVVGLMNTIWCPMRMLCGIEQFAMALGGAWFNDPSADPRDAVARFARSQFGLARPDSVAAGVLKLSAIMPQRTVLRRLMGSEALPSGPLTACEAEQAADLFGQARRLSRLFEHHLPRVGANEAEYRNLILAADILAWAALVGVARPASGDGAARQASRGTVLRTLLAEGRRLLKLCRADWNRGRYRDDPKRDLDWGRQSPKRAIGSPGKPGRWPDALIPNLHLAVARLDGKA